MNSGVVTYDVPGEIARELRLGGEVVVPTWQSNAIGRPKEEFRFHLPAKT